MLKHLARYKLHHLVIWLTYYIFWVYTYKSYYTTLMPLLINTSFYLFFNASGFYIIGYWLAPKYLYTHKTGRFICYALITLLIMAFGLALCQMVLFDNLVIKYYKNWRYLIISDIMSTFFTVGLILSIKLLINKLLSDRKNEQAEKQRLETELQFLKAQVNPHFLFNSINSVYVLIRKDPDLAAKTLIKLSDLLRLQLYEFSDNQIPIEKEVDYIHNFIALESLRKGDSVKVVLNIGLEVKGFSLAPFLILPFLENAFKYVSADRNGKKKIEVDLAIKGDQFFVRVFNTFNHSQVVDQGGLGLKNLRRRLDVLYSGFYSLQLQPGEDFYEARLSLQNLLKK